MRNERFGGVEEGCGGAEGAFKVLDQLAVSVDPFDVRSTTPLRMDRGTGLVGEFADDLDSVSGIGNACAVVGAVSEGMLDKAMSSLRLSEKRHASLHVGRASAQFESAAIAIDHDVPLAPYDLLAIIAFR